MTTLIRPLTLDEYRAQVVMQLKACADPTRATELLSDVERMFAATQTSRSLQRTFWTGLSQDLDLLVQRAALLDPQAAATLRAVITSVRAVTVRAFRLLQDVD